MKSPKIHQKSMTNQSKIYARKKPKNLCQNGSKIVEHLSKNLSKADLGPLILGFRAFWNDAKKSIFLGTSPVAKKNEKSALGWPRGVPAVKTDEWQTTFWGSGPQGGLTRDQKLDTRNKKQGQKAKRPMVKGKVGSWKGKQAISKDLTGPRARGPANFGREAAQEIDFERKKEPKGTNNEPGGPEWNQTRAKISQQSCLFVCPFVSGWGE